MVLISRREEWNFACSNFSMTNLYVLSVFYTVGIIMHVQIVWGDFCCDRLLKILVRYLLVSSTTLGETFCWLFLPFNLLLHTITPFSLPSYLHWCGVPISKSSVLLADTQVCATLHFPNWHISMLKLIWQFGTQRQKIFPDFLTGN